MVAWDTLVNTKVKESGHMCPQCVLGVLRPVHGAVHLSSDHPGIMLIPCVNRLQEMKCPAMLARQTRERIVIC